MRESGTDSPHLHHLDVGLFDIAPAGSESESTPSLFSGADRSARPRSIRHHVRVGVEHPVLRQSRGKRQANKARCLPLWPQGLSAYFHTLFS
jgi:hypothetical protein